MKPRFGAWLALAILLPIEGGNVLEYHAVCDAGSTGTRLYVFALDVAAGKAESVFVKKTKPGLSSYAAAPTKAVGPLLELLREGALKIPEDLRAKTSLLIFGTAGMRMLPSEEQALIWNALHDSFQKDESFPFDRRAVQARTVSGDEEGLWAVLATNFLLGKMRHDLLSLGGAPLGLLDLGGSSTQIGVPSTAAARKGTNFSHDVVVKSYLGFGMTHIREQVRKESSDGGDASCYMKGTLVDGLRGTGNGSQCRKLIHQYLLKKSQICREGGEDSCLGDLSTEASRAVQGSFDFVGVSGLTYVADFVRWWLAAQPPHPSDPSSAQAFLSAYPKPTLTELQTAIDLMCSGDYSWVEAQTKEKSTAHQYTAHDNAPYRCFQANYMLTLLREIYGFPQDARRVTFALEAAGEDLEWPLGALLHHRSVAPAEPSGEL